MGARTVSGVRKLREILGFEEFLERAEEDRLRRMIESPADFEAILPHAMALGVDERWAEAFDDIYREPPDWYVGYGPGPFRASVLTHQLARALTARGTEAAVVATSSPAPDEKRPT